MLKRFTNVLIILIIYWSGFFCSYNLCVYAYNRYFPGNEWTYMQSTADVLVSTLSWAAVPLEVIALISKSISVSVKTGVIGI